MKIIYNIILIMSLILGATACLCAEEDKAASGYDYKEQGIEEKATIRPGMEIKKIGNINMLVPEGTEIYGNKGQYRVEGSGGYAARKFKETDERLSKIEAYLKSLDSQIEALRATVESLRLPSDNKTSAIPAQE